MFGRFTRLKWKYLELENAYKGLKIEQANNLQLLKESGAYCKDLKEQIKALEKSQKAYISQYLLKALNSVITLDNAAIYYDLLKMFDCKGWCLYKISEKLIPGDVFQYFYEEDCIGRFEESDGYELTHFRELMRFGECNYIIHGAYELLDEYQKNDEIPEYKDYLKRLYKDTSVRIIEEHCIEIIEKEPDIVEKIKNMNTVNYKGALK